MRKESDIQRAILDFLEASAVFHWRCNLGGVRRSGIGMTRNPMRGFPDIAGICPGSVGRLFGVEVKAPTGRQSDDQRKWERKLRAAGVIVIVATCVEDVRRGLGLHLDPVSFLDDSGAGVAEAFVADGGVVSQSGSLAYQSISESPQTQGAVSPLGKA